jgi:hypothetical protein
VDDLSMEWDATAELARYHWDRRAGPGKVPEAWAVIADVKRDMRASMPIPHAAPRPDDLSTVLALVREAEGRISG